VKLLLNGTAAWLCVVALVAATGCFRANYNSDPVRRSQLLPTNQGLGSSIHPSAPTTTVQPPARSANDVVNASIRGQNAGYPTTNDNRYPDIGPGGYTRSPMPTSGAPGYQQPNPSTYNSDQPQTVFQPNNFGAPNSNVPFNATSPLFTSPEALPSPSDVIPLGQGLGLPPNFADIDAVVEEARTGRLMFGVGVNSSAGLTGQITLDEKNFDITRIPTSFDDWVNGTAFRGNGQGLRIEAQPGTVVQRYLFNFTEPYLLGTDVSFGVSGFFYDRGFFDWDEQRIGGRVSLGYRLTPDLSVSAAMRAEEVDIRNPRVAGVPELDSVLGDNELYSPGVTLTHDTRDVPFAATQGHLIELSYSQVFGTWDYPRGDIDLRKYHLLYERPDGSGRHTFSYGFRFGFSGSQTPVYDNYFAGGFSTMRGFDFRGASPLSGGVIVGGEYRFLGSVEYTFPLTADDMLKGVVFVDYGTVEERIEINSEDFRVAPGFGFRVTIPAMGPAPLAFDFAFPVAMEATDDEQIFSFFIGLGRL